MILDPHLQILSANDPVTVMAHRICDMVQTPRPDRVICDNSQGPYYAAGALLTDDSTAILVGPGFLEFFTEPEAYAVLTHEIGHLAAGHCTPEQKALVTRASKDQYGAAPVLWAMEFVADDMVKKAGMAGPFKTALFKLAKMYRGIAYDAPTHPGIIRRIKRLE